MASSKATALLIPRSRLTWRQIFCPIHQTRPSGAMLVSVYTLELSDGLFPQCQ